MKDVMTESYVKAQAHGRVNLIGEHTDYNGGWVLPTTIPQKTTVTLLRRQDNEVHAYSTNSLKSSRAGDHYTLGKETVTNTWLDYLQGITKILQAEGHRLSGFDVHVDSTVPVGSGLSSSAALEISVLKALREAFHLKLTDEALALIGQRTENEFVGARVGIMDQMACALANAGEALFLDTKTLAYEHVRIPTEKMDLIVINSGLAHQNSSGSYNQRRAECEEACKLLGVQELRELDIKDLPRLEKLPEVLKRRARHVITENQRVHEAVKALRSGEMEKLGQLFYESHDSMSQDYAVSIPEIDLLVKICRRQPDVYGARLTGGGFGGSIVAISKPGAGSKVAKAVVAAYAAETSHTATILVGL
jgi:galactokinase